MLHSTAVLLFALTAGFTSSGIVANLYRLLTNGQKQGVGRTIYYASLVVAGPSMLFEKATQEWRQKNCSWVAFWLAAAIAAYWSLAIGLIVMEIALAI